MTATIGTAGVTENLPGIDAPSPHDHVIAVATMSKVKTMVTGRYHGFPRASVRKPAAGKDEDSCGQDGSAHRSGMCRRESNLRRSS